jgi:hypothetical protein
MCTNTAAAVYSNVHYFQLFLPRMRRTIFSFSSGSLNKWFLFCMLLMLGQMYLNTGTLSGYAATLDKPALYNGYYVNYDWPQYVFNYNFMMGKSALTWQGGAVLRRELLFIIGYPFYKMFGFYAGGMITIVLTLISTLFFFFRFVEKRFGENATKVAMVLLCTYTGIMYWIGSPFVHNLIVPICLWIYMLMTMMRERGFRFNIAAVCIIGILFTGYDLIALFGPAILIFILFHRKFSPGKRVLLELVAVAAFIIPQLLIKWWLLAQGGHMTQGNDNSFSIIMNAYLNFFNEVDLWIQRVKLMPDTLVHSFFFSNFFVLPILFGVCWLFGRLVFKFRLNLVERCILFNIILLFIFNNAAPPYEGEWQMWGGWLARLYQSVFIVYLMFIIRLSAFIYSQYRFRILHTGIIGLAVTFNLVINLGGFFASPLTSYVYACFYIHGSGDSMVKNIKYYGARPLGFPVHYAHEIHD